jgi:hypothetical protein
LVAAHEMNDPLRARLEPWFVLAQDFPAERAFGNVEAGQFAAILAEGYDAFEAADKAHVQLRSRPGAQEFA